MSRKPLSVIVLLSLAILAACSDLTGPETQGVCQINGGPGTCASASK